jgi:hypothetical protein
VHPQEPAEVLGLLAATPAAREREVGAVELEDEAGAVDLVVLDLHRVGDRGEVRVVVAVVGIREEERHDAGRRGAEERLLDRLDAVRRGAQCGDVGADRLLVAIGDRAVAGGHGGPPPSPSPSPLVRARYSGNSSMSGEGPGGSASPPKPSRRSVA